MVVHTNTTILENVYFIESGSITGSTGFQSVFPTFTAFTVENFMIGVSSFTAVGATAFNFNFQLRIPLQCGVRLNIHRHQHELSAL
jgi:hypothetical protein